MTRRPKWIRARVGRDGVNRPLLQLYAIGEYGYKPGALVVIMSAAEARWLKAARRELVRMHAEELAEMGVPGPCECGWCPERRRRA